MTSFLANWTPDQITNLVIAVTGLVTSIATAAATFWKLMGFSAKVESASKDAEHAKTQADDGKKRMDALQGQITQVALATPAPPVVPVKFGQNGEVK
jgi:hypothetical protein